MHPTIWTFAWLLGLPLLVGCQAPAEVPASAPEALRVRCTPLIGDDGAVAVHVSIENVSDATLHIFDSQRLPYVLEEDDDLLILYGVHPPEPHRDYFMIEIPSTTPLPPGARIADAVSLTPLYLGDHYSLPRERNTPVTKHGTVMVRCAVGWGETPILPRPEEQHVHDIQDLLTWQELSRSTAIQVEFP